MKYLIYVCVILLFFVTSASAQEPVDDKQQLEIVQKKLVSHFKADEFGKALRPAEEILELSIKLFGAESSDVATAHANLGVIYRERGNYKDAVAHFQKAANIRSKRSTAAHSDVHKRMHVVALLATAQTLDGNKTEAERNLKLAIEIAEEVFGKESKESLQPILDIANFYSFDKKYDRADEFYLKSLKIAREKFGEAADKQKEIVEDSRLCFRPSVEVGDKDYQDARKQLFLASDLGSVINGKAVKLPKPDYPYEARSKRIVGQIPVRVKIDEIGNVYETRAVCGHPILIKSSEDAAMKAKFTPTLVNGKPIKVIGVINYRFVQGRI